MRRPRRSFILAGLAAGLLLSAAPAAAQTYTGDADVAVSDATVVAGGAVTFSGNGFASFCPLAISVDQARVGSETADSGGAFSTEVTLRETGMHTLAAEGCGEQATVEVEVVGAAGGGLPVTGFSPVTVFVGGGLLLAGTVLVAVARQRRREGAQV